MNFANRPRKSYSYYTSREVLFNRISRLTAKINKVLSKKNVNISFFVLIAFNKSILTPLEFHSNGTTLPLETGISLLKIRFGFWSWMWYFWSHLAFSLLWREVLKWQSKIIARLSFLRLLIGLKLSPVFQPMRNKTKTNHSFYSQAIFSALWASHR